MAIPIITVSPASRFPSQSFFLAERDRIAEHWVGQLDAEDLEASYDGGKLGSGFIYQTSPKQTRRVSRCFVYGEIDSIQDRIAETRDISDPFMPTKRMGIKRFTSSTRPADIIFGNNVLALSELIKEEVNKGAIAADEWTVNKNLERSEEGIIFVDCGPLTEYKNGPLSIGHCVLFDVSLHRYDTFPEGVSFISQAYSIAAHSAESVSRSWLRGEGWIDTELGKLSPAEMMSLQHEMQRVKVGEDEATTQLDVLHSNHGFEADAEHSRS